MTRDDEAQGQTTIFLCETCAWPDGENVKDERAGGEAFAELVEAASNAQVTVRRHPCLMNCAWSCSGAVTAPGKTTDVLGRFEPDAKAAAALVAYAVGHAESESGAAPFRSSPQGVNGKFIARVPPLGDR